MDPAQLTQFFKDYFAIGLTVFTALVTGSSFLLRMIASYCKSMKDAEPNYQPSKALIMFMAILSAISQNSITAANVISESKNRDNPTPIPPAQPWIPTGRK